MINELKEKDLEILLMWSITDMTYKYDIIMALKRSGKCTITIAQPGKHPHSGPEWNMCKKEFGNKK